MENKKKKSQVVVGNPVKAAGQSVTWKETSYPTVYANISSLAITPFDISLTVGEVNTANEKSVEATPLVRLILSPEHASVVMQLLGQGLSQFVAGNGNLRPAGMIHVPSANVEGQHEG